MLNLFSEPVAKKRGVLQRRELTWMRFAWLTSALVSFSIIGHAAVEKPKIIRVVLDNNYDPYSFQSPEGKLQGILIDQWQAWEKQTGIKVELHAMHWGDAVERMRAGEFDVIDSIVETRERREHFDFTSSYTAVEASIFFRNDISGITDLASLKGFPVGGKAGDQHVDMVKASGVTTVILFQNYDAMIESAQQRKINVFVADDPTALYLLNKAGIANNFRQSAPISHDELRRAVRKGNGALLRTVTDGFAAIAPNELKQIDEKWFGRPINGHARYLTYAGYAAAAALLLIAGLATWNRTLRTRVLERTLALSESELRFRQIAENTHEIFWLTTVDFSSTLYISPAYTVIWARSCESLYQEPRSFISAIHPHDRTRVLAGFERDHERGFEIEYRVVRPDGSIRWISDRGFPIKDENACVYRLARIAEDITEQKQAIEAVKHAEDQLHLMLDTIPTMAWTVLPNGTVDFLNQRWLDYAGTSMAEVLKDPTGRIHPEDLSRSVERWSMDMAAGKPFEYEMRLRRSDGEYRWFLVRTVPMLDEHGQILKWYGTSIDIEDRKRAERESQLLIDAIPQQIWSGPPDGTLDYCNDRWRSYMGLRLEDLQGDGWQTMLHPDDRDRVLKAWHEAVANGTPYQMEERHRGADGTYRWFLALGVPLRDAEGRIIRWYGTNTDIEDRKQAEEKLQQTQKALARVARTTTVGELTASIAHEVNQPLAAVVTNADACLRWLAGDAPNLEEARAALQRIVRDGNRASDVIARVRSLLKHDRPVKTPFNLEEMIGEIIALTKTEALRRQVSLQTNLPPHLPHVTGDRVQLQQVLMNLMMNSLDALNEIKTGSRLLKIEVTMESADTISVAVQDNATGIDPQQVRNLFEPFHTTKAGGLGLGLWISRSIVEAHGGRLVAEPNDGPGARFSFTLPLDGTNHT